MEHIEQRREVEMYLSTNQLMQMLGISRSTVYRLMDKGLPAIKVGAVNRFPKDQVLAWRMPLFNPPSFGSEILSILDKLEVALGLRLLGVRPTGLN